MAIRFFDMFAGIGGFRSGLEAVGGFECIGHCEIDKYANQAYNAIYDVRGELYFEDARTINPNEMPELDLITAGFPCQSFSVAGRRLGFADTRGTLFFEVARIAEAKRPAYLLLENVPGLLSHDSGRTLNTIFSTLTELGYDLEWCVHNSANFGVPQQRRRLYIVASLGGGSAGQIFPLACGNAENLKELIPGPQGARVYDPNGVACTQTAGAGGWGGKTGLYFIDMNPDPIITDTARCITARQDSGVSNHRGEHSAVLVTNEPRAILTPDRETVRQQGRRVKEPNEPIVTQELWDTVHKILNAKHRPAKTGEVQMFAGLLYCSDCDHCLTYSQKKRKDGTYHGAYSCWMYKTHGKEYCSSHYITFDTIYNLVLIDIQRNLFTYRHNSKQFREFLSSRYQSMLNQSQ